MERRESDGRVARRTAAMVGSSAAGMVALLLRSLTESEKNKRCKEVIDLSCGSFNTGEVTEGDEARIQKAQFGLAAATETSNDIEHNRIISKSTLPLNSTS